MRMPGFTAEASLREAATDYRARAVLPHSGGVVPAALCWECSLDPWGRRHCQWVKCYVPWVS
jgi:hypothetical protein